MKRKWNWEFILNHKKLLLKVAVGILLLTAAFFMYLQKNVDQGDVIVLETPVNLPASEEEVISKQAISTPQALVIHVSGAVKQPGIVELEEGGRVYEAIAQAGGLSDNADTYSVNLAAVLKDGDKLFIPETGMEEESRAAGGIVTESLNSGIKERVNLNTANSAELETLTGVGPSTAEKILQYRQMFGDFKKIEDLMNVSGIGPKTFEKLKDSITV